MTAPILLTGGTGTLGQLVLPRLRAADQTVRVTSRSAHPASDGVEYVVADFLSGTGLDAAVTGVDTIIHCAGNAKDDERMTRNLVRAAERAKVRHLVFISVVGANADTYAYFRAKLAAERAVRESGLGWTILRASQFHDLILGVLRVLTKSPVVPTVTGFQVQPIDADVVAARLVELALADEPQGRVEDMAGPRVYPMRELVKSYLDATGKRRALVPMRMPGRAARRFAAGVNLAPDHAAGGRTWEEFLAEHVGSRQ